MKRELTERERIFANHVPEKRLASGIGRALEPSKEEPAKGLNRNFSTEDTKMANKY